MMPFLATDKWYDIRDLANLSSFILENALRAARKELAVVDTISLGLRDAERFFDLLMNPPAPSAALKNAMSEHKKRIVR